MNVLDQKKEMCLSFDTPPCVIPKRFERLTHALEGRCSIQLSYGTSLICGCKGSAFYENSKTFWHFFIHIFLCDYESVVYNRGGILFIYMVWEE